MNNLPTPKDFLEDENNIIDHFNKLLSTGIEDDATFISSFYEEVPKIYICGHVDISQISLADYGFIGLIYVQKCEDAITLGKTVFEYAKKIEEFLPLFARVYQIPPSSCRGKLVEGFRLVRFSSFQFEDCELLTVEEVKEFSINKSKTQIAQAMETVEIMELLTNQARWYTVYHDSSLIIQADEPFNGRLRKESKDIVEIALPACIRVVGLIDDYLDGKDKPPKDEDKDEEEPLEDTASSKDKTGTTPMNEDKTREDYSV